MMNDEDINEYHSLDKLKENYKPLPYGLIIADSQINGQGLFTTRKLVRGTHLGESHYRMDGKLIRTPLGGFINHYEPGAQELGDNIIDLETEREYRKQWPFK